MSAIDSQRADWLAPAWLLFAGVNAFLMYVLPGRETIPYHLIWASFALVYGLQRWGQVITWVVFSGITVVTGVPIVWHAKRGYIGWEECSEIVLMGVIAALLVWHVNRHESAQDRIAELHEAERVRAHNRDLATRFGSHELRTRLTIARGFTDLIRECTEDERTRIDAEMAVTELDKAVVVATNLMTLVRVDTPLDLQPVDLDALIESIVQRWVTHVKRAWRATTSAGTVRADAERLEAAMDCLLENAVKFTGPSDLIAVDARLSGNVLVITVDDSGTGIPPEDVARVSELFHTSSNAGDRAGSGFGLPIVRAIMAAHGGSMEISSTLGTGTRITIRLPQAAMVTEWRPTLPQQAVPAPRHPAAIPAEA